MDTVKPTVGVPTVTPRTGVPLNGSSIPVTVTWAGGDNAGGAGIAGYTLQRSLDGGSTWSTLASGLTSASRTTTVPSSGTTRFRVRATDKAGNTSAYATGGSRTGRLVQQSSGSVGYSGSWTLASSSKFSGGTVRHASTAGRAAAYTFTGKSIAVVSTRSSDPRGGPDLPRRGAPGDRRHVPEPGRVPLGHLAAVVLERGDEAGSGGGRGDGRPAAGGPRRVRRDQVAFRASDRRRPVHGEVQGRWACTATRRCAGLGALLLAGGLVAGTRGDARGRPRRHRRSRSTPLATDIRERRRLHAAARRSSRRANISRRAPPPASASPASDSAHDRVRRQRHDPRSRPATALPDHHHERPTIDGGGDITIDGSNEPGTGLCLCHNGAAPLEPDRSRPSTGTAITVQAYPGISNVEVFANRQGITIGAGWGLSIQDSRIHGNEGTSGSGIYAQRGRLRAPSRRSAIYANSSVAEGGGIRMVGATVTVDQSTISGNSGTTGGGIYMESPTADSTLKVYNSTIADNVARRRRRHLPRRQPRPPQLDDRPEHGDDLGWRRPHRRHRLDAGARRTRRSWATPQTARRPTGPTGSRASSRPTPSTRRWASPARPSVTTSARSTLADNGGPTLTLKPKLVAGNVLIDGGDATVCASDPDQRQGPARVRPAQPLRHRRGGRRPHEARRVRHLGVAPAGPDALRHIVAGRVTWTSSDSGSGAARYTIQRRVDGGSWSTLATGVTSPVVRRDARAHARLPVPRPGDRQRRQHRVVHDEADVRVAPLPADVERVRLQRPLGDLDLGRLLGREHAAEHHRRGSSARFTATGRSFAWITTTGPTRGMAQST